MDFFNLVMSNACFQWDRSLLQHRWCIPWRTVLWTAHMRTDEGHWQWGLRRPALAGESGASQLLS